MVGMTVVSFTTELTIPMVIVAQKVPGSPIG
jgi:hypothetical protein